MFRFRLEPVLKYRQFLEDQKLAEFAEKQRLLENEKAALRELKTMRRRYFEALREESRKEDVDVSMMSFFQSYIFFLDRRVTEQLAVVARAQKAADQAMLELVEARKQKEVLVKVKEKKFKEYRYEEERQDQLQLDDVASIKYIRDRSGLSQFAV
jgi:flagellar FliJ protein